jgi:hypothetical protein
VAFRSFWRVLTDPDVSGRVAQALEPATTGPDLRILAVLQRDGRLVDFLQEEIDAYSDAQIGAAVREVHRGSRKALRDYLGLEPVLAGDEGSTVLVPAGFDPAAIRLTGNVSGDPPFRGTLAHAGWKVARATLPVVPPARDHVMIVAPAEVEIA